ncbi:hypothetical protein C0J52_20704 [Blattella germanica]|nr:hypothetical protein C0J52_20704 [Blattella germanica]
MWRLYIAVVHIISLCSGDLLYNAEIIPQEQHGTGKLSRSLSITRHGYDQQTSATEPYRNREVFKEHGIVGFYGATGQKGSRAHLSNDRYAGDHQDAHGDRTNSGYYHDDTGVHSAHDAGYKGYGDRAYGHKEQAVEAYGSQGGHRKGHHSSGFKNSYYKDESGNNSRFYDDTNDEGGHYQYDGRGGGYYDNGANSFHGNYDDAVYRDAANNKQAEYGEGARFDDRSGQKGRYAQDNFYDDQSEYEVEKSAKDIGKVGEYYGDLRGYVRPYTQRYYRPKVYYPVESYPITYATYYKEKPADINFQDRGKGYAEFVDIGGKGGYRNEPDYIR